MIVEEEGQDEEEKEKEEGTEGRRETRKKIWVNIERRCITKVLS